MNTAERPDHRSTITAFGLILYIIIPAIIMLGYWYGSNFAPYLLEKGWFCLFFGFGRIFAIISLIINVPLTVLKLMNMRYDKKHSN